MFKRRLLSSSIAMVAALGSLNVSAQENSGESLEMLEEVIVTGVRASVTKAIDIKRESMQVMDSIVAEDIGKLPDNNVVESLQRVAGVQVTNRASGEVNTVTIRGLTDVSTTINGRTIFTASGRDVALADIPSTLVNRIDVIKNRSAGQFENGIAGQIDVQTFRPLDFDGSKVSVSARGIYLEEAESIDPVISGLFSNTWDTSAGEFGALFNVSYAETTYRDQSVTPGAQVAFMTENPTAPWIPLERIFPNDGRAAEQPIWTPGLDNGLPIAPGSTLSVNGTDTEYYLSRDAMFMADYNGERERQAANISLQWAPNDASTYTFEAFYNGFRNEGFNSLNFAFVDWWGSLSELGNVEDTFELYEGTNVIKERTVRNPWTFTSGDQSTGETDSFLYALGGEWDFTDNLRLKSELVYQDSTFESSFIAMRSEGARHQVTANFSNDPSMVWRDNPDTPDVDESDLTDINVFPMAQMYDSGEKNEGEALTFTADGEYDMDGFFRKFTFGLRHDDRDSMEYSRNQDAGVCAGANTTDDPANCDFATYGDDIAYVNDGFLDGEFDVPSSWAVANGYYIADNRTQFLNLYGLDPNDPLVAEFSVNEVNTALYATAQFEVDLGSMRLDGEVGARYVDVTTDTVFTDSVTLETTEGTTETSELLPSLALRLHLTDELLLRFGYGETLRMPWFGDLNPTITYNDDITGIGYGTANGGNSDLAPTTSQNLDLSLEWYFGDASNAYVTLFQRDIEGLVIGFRNQVTRDIEGYEANTFILSQPDNASDGELSGVELGMNYFPELDGALDGLGFQAAFTFLDSEQTIPELNDRGEQIGTETADIFGVSDKSYSLAVVYERESFDARLAYVWRSDFLYDNEAALFANPIRRYRDEQSSLDAQISYNVTDEFVVTFDAVNLTGEVNKSRYGNSPYHTFGNWKISRSFAVGARYSF
ncbi:TonB-dependent receptor [Gilvimarinus sp. SDUM040013]|uniref:TonB-dependent receptor n=1 Tax=Gilvimarinus gilvus TaxID=3058038 RepID=A0ABU4S624_9GAMM|nr:TonB-dependent receptor [Gilvimarinus sp. SDUM040013]MDO3387231.1 TonB-dependent receptor [Gilvimarinus sp. SDUM040013]MDX6850794.1 TonB-dependent receptor [Gilvimarinus sp. SDUM040013]